MNDRIANPVLLVLAWMAIGLVVVGVALWFVELVASERFVWLALAVSGFGLAVWMGLNASGQPPSVETRRRQSMWLCLGYGSFALYKVVTT